jgi:hypothetical protein
MKDIEGAVMKEDSGAASASIVGLVGAFVSMMTLFACY